MSRFFMVQCVVVVAGVAAATTTIVLFQYSTHGTQKLKEPV